MAADLGLSPEILDTEASHPDKGREKPQSGNELLEYLRSRCGQHRSWSDSIKAVKVNLMNDKRLYESVERLNLQSCLDKLHRAMKISSQQSLMERLELICRQLGMLFTPPTPPENNIILSAEMFKVVITLEGQNGIRDVRVGHQDNPTTCEDLVEVLRKGDFDEFVTHIQGFLSIYNITGDKKLKTKGYLALSSLESDLNLLAQLQSSINGVAKYIHKSPLGILLPRRGGYPMKLIYFVSPYDLLCKKTRMSYAMTVEAIAEKNVGHSVTVAIEPSATLNKLQTMPLMSVKQNSEGKSLPSFQAVNSMNSFSLAANFVLVLPQPIPIAKSVLCAIQEITGLDVVAGKEQSLLSLLLQQCTDGQITSTKELFVTLPDQQHAYFLNHSGEGCLGQGAALVTKIPFTQPTCVPNILNLLRQQLMFNSVMQSLMRPSAKKDYKSSLIFEVTALSLQYISVMFEHPLQDSMVTAEFDLSDITSVKCIICMANKDETLCTDEFVSRAFQRCFSIPVTLRMVIHKVNEQITKLVPPEPVSKLVARTILKWLVQQQTAVKNVSSTVLNTNPVQQTAAKDNWTQGSHVDVRKVNKAPALNRTFLEPPPPSEDDKMGANPLLATLLETAAAPVEPAVSHNVVSESPMLSKLLEENTSVTTNLPPPNSNPKKRLVKRKSSKDVITGKSPKYRPSDSEMIDRTGGSASNRMPNQLYGQGIAEKHIDLDSSGGSYDDPVQPSSVGSVSGHSSTGSIIDLTDIGIGESHVKKLENSLDSIMQKESRALTMNMNSNVNMNSQLPPDFMDMNDFHHVMNPHQMMDGMGDFAHPQQWGSRQTPPHPMARNSPHHGLQKNEKISTSLEDLLLGPGGREMEGPIPMQGRRNSNQRRQSLKRQNSVGRNSFDGSTGVVSPDVFSPVMTSPGQYPLPSPSHLPLHSPNQAISPGSFSMTSPGLLTASSPSFTPGSNIKSEMINMVDSKMGVAGGPQSHFPVNMLRGGNMMNSSHHVSSGKPSLSALKAQLEMKNDVNLSGGSLTQEKDIKMEEDYGNIPSMKLKLNMKHYDSVSPAGSDESKSRTSTFDFHSDDEDFSLPVVDKITIVSSSPTRLQISNKPTLTRFNNFNKTEKFKRKEREKQMKHVSTSLDSGKRKRAKDESKKERKKRRMTNNDYSVDKEMAVYRSTTVDVEAGSDNYKPITKLKITKSGGKMSIENSTVLKVKEVKPVKTEKPRIDSVKVDKEAVLKIEKLDNKPAKREEKAKPTSLDIKDVKLETKSTTDSKEKVTTPRSSTTSNEGIFEKINAMKSDNVSKGDSDVIMKDKTTNDNVKKSSSSSKSQKVSKSSTKVNSNSKSLSDSLTKTTKSPTIKLKPISVPSNSSSGNSAPQANSPSTPSTPKSITQSPTSTTIGKIGAVSLATSGTQKPLNQSNTNSGNKPSGLASSNSSNKGTSNQSNSNSGNKQSGVSNQSSTNSGSKSSGLVSSNSGNKATGTSNQSSTNSVSKGSGVSNQASSNSGTKTTGISNQSSSNSGSKTTGLSNSSNTNSGSKASGVSGQSSSANKQSGSSTQSSTNSTNSKQSSSNKVTNSTSKTNSSTSQSSVSATKSSASGSSQKTVSVSSGKNSPVLQTSKSAHSRSLSNPNASLSKSDKGLSKTMSSSSVRTSSPSLDKERSKSNSGASRSSASSSREREKSTSSKNNVPVTTVITQETAASVLSFLNPKANKISSLPPIPKLSSSSSGTPRVSTPVSSVSVTVTSTSPSMSTTANITSSKYGKGNHPSNKQTNSFMHAGLKGTSSPGGKGSTNSPGTKGTSNSPGTKGTNSPNMPGNKGVNSQNTFNKSGSTNYSNNNRGQNQSGSGKKSGTDSPVNYSMKSGSNQYNKNMNSSNSQNPNSGFRNNHSTNTNPSRNYTGQVNSTNQIQNKASKSPNSYNTNKGGNLNVSNRNSGSSPVNRVSSGPSSSSNSVSRPNITQGLGSNSVTSVTSVQGGVSGSNTPRGPGPPNTSHHSTSVTSASDMKKPTSSNISPHSSNSRGRKGSLSAVIDKLTCKASIPVSSSDKPVISSQSSKHIIEESPASPEPESANSLTGSLVKEEKKVVIFEAPASPEPEHVGATIKRTGSVDGIVSIPLDQRRESLENLMAGSSEVRNVNGDKNDRSNKSTPDKSGFVKPSNSLSEPDRLSVGLTNTDKPKVIPLNSNGDTPPASIQSTARPSPSSQSTARPSPSIQSAVTNTKPPHHRQNSLPNKALNYSQQNGDISQGLTNESNSDLSATIQNDSCRDNTKDNPFKVPTPKSVEEQSKVQDESENPLNLLNKKIIPPSPLTKSVSNSPPSSPENGLIIDFSTSPKKAVNKTHSPMCNTDMDLERERTSPVLKSGLVSTGSSSKLKNSPCSLDDIDNLSAEGDSPFLDDDLMDAALGL